MIKNFERICGVSPDGNENIDFQASDPNFVFENDPLFETVVLYDQDGNVINVNSWIECAHYVNGGWDIVNYQNFGGDQAIFFGLILTFSVYVLLRKFLISND